MTSQPANHEIAGYMPGRLEFETEYENEAEQTVKDMLFSEEDTAEEVGMFFDSAFLHTKSMCPEMLIIFRVCLTYFFPLPTT
jgi:hypothetical protein